MPDTEKPATETLQDMLDNVARTPDQAGDGTDLVQARHMATAALEQALRSMRVLTKLSA